MFQVHTPHRKKIAQYWENITGVSEDVSALTAAKLHKSLPFEADEFLLGRFIPVVQYLLAVLSTLGCCSQEGLAGLELSS